MKIRGDKNFTKWRGGDISRLEAFTDAVFAIANTASVNASNLDTSPPRQVVKFLSPLIFINFFILVLD